MKASIFVAALLVGATTFVAGIRISTPPKQTRSATLSWGTAKDSSGEEDLLTNNSGFSRDRSHLLLPGEVEERGKPRYTWQRRRKSKPPPAFTRTKHVQMHSDGELGDLDDRILCPDNRVDLDELNRRNDKVTDPGFWGMSDKCESLTKDDLNGGRLTCEDFYGVGNMRDHKVKLDVVTQKVETATVNSISHDEEDGLLFGRNHHEHYVEAAYQTKYYPCETNEPTWLHGRGYTGFRGCKTSKTECQRECVDEKKAKYADEDKTMKGWTNQLGCQDLVDSCAAPDTQLISRAQFINKHCLASRGPCRNTQNLVHGFENDECGQERLPNYVSCKDKEDQTGHVVSTICELGTCEETDNRTFHLLGQIQDSRYLTRETDDNGKTTCSIELELDDMTHQVKHAIHEMINKGLCEGPTMPDSGERKCRPCAVVKLRDTHDIHTTRVGVHATVCFVISPYDKRVHMDRIYKLRDGKEDRFTPDFRQTDYRINISNALY